MKPVRDFVNWYLKKKNLVAIAAGGVVTQPAARAKMFPWDPGTSSPAITPEAAADDSSPIRLLYTQEQLSQAVQELRAMLARDESPECQAGLKSPFAANLKTF